MDRPAILVRCEGSGTLPVARNVQDAQGLCSCCGEVVDCDPAGRLNEHQRQDLLAMLHRGDFG